MRKMLRKEALFPVESLRSVTLEPRNLNYDWRYGEKKKCILMKVQLEEQLAGHLLLTKHSA